MKAFYVCVHTNTNVTHGFLVFEETAIKAVHKLNYNLRQEKKARQEENPKDEYRQVTRLSDMVNAIRRMGRKYKDRFAACNFTPVTVYELPQGVPYSVAYFQIGGSIGYVENLLPEVPLHAAQDSQGL
jgi:hypothetical protein